MKKVFLVALVVVFFMMGGLAFGQAANFYAGAGVSGEYDPGSVDSDPVGWGEPVYPWYNMDMSVGGGGASTPGEYSGNFSTESGYGSYGGSISVQSFSNGSIVTSSSYSRVSVFGNPE